MSKLPANEDVLTNVWGPHLNRMEGMRLDTGAEPDRVVNTHCCFCGQQCGIQLKVKDNVVIGFEPWHDFPFNRGMLCPKGVKRYLQGAHPDRLTTALRRDAAAPHGFSAMPYDAYPTLVARTTVGARCSARVIYTTGRPPRSFSGYEQIVGKGGTVRWDWHEETKGTGCTATVYCSLNGQTATASATFPVT